VTLSRARVIVEEAAVAERIAAVLDVADLERDDQRSDVTIVSHGRLDQAGDSAGPVVVLCKGTGRRAALELIASKALRYLVPVDDRLEDALLTILGKLAGADLFGLDRYVRHGGLLRTWTAEDSHAKASILREIGARAQRLGCPQLIADLFLSAIDEMAINAIERHIRAQLGPIEIVAAAEVGRFAVAVRDRVGQLRPEHVLGSLVRGGAQKTTGMALDASSAQLGFRIMFDTLSTLAINVERGRRTEVIGVIDLGKSLREYRDTVPGFGCFVNETPEP
jgi:hypothetical protein